MPNDDNDSWSGFDFNTWGTPTEGGAASQNGHHPDADADAEGADEELRGEGEWVTEGGVMHWEEGDLASDDRAKNLRAEANSRWAADDLELPLGAPDPIRIRAVRAWLARQHMLENEAIGFLLLERRRQQGDGSDDESTLIATDDVSPLVLAMAEHSASLQGYEQLLIELDDLTAHAGPSHVLVEYYLLLGERLADLAGAPEAPDDFAAYNLIPIGEKPPANHQPTPRSQAEWQGLAESVLRTRRRVERMSAPEPED